MEAGTQVLVVLAFLGLLIGVLRWLQTRRGLVWRPGARGGMRYLRAVEHLRLTATHSVHLVRYGDRAVLIAVSPAGVSSIEITSWNALVNNEPARSTQASED